MSFWGVNKKISTFTDDEIDDINSFIVDINLSLAKHKLKFDFNIDSLKNNKWERFSNNFILTDLLSYNLFNNGEIINQIFFKKFYENKIIKDSIYFRIELKNDDLKYLHKFEAHSSLGIKFHHRYNKFGQLPPKSHIDYSDYKPNEILKNENLKKHHFTEFKNNLGRSYEEYIMYLNDQKKRIKDYLTK